MPKSNDNKPTTNDGRFKKGNKIGKQFSSEYQPKDLKLKRAVKKLFQEVAKQELENLQEYATLKMSEWVRQKLDNVEMLSTQELEKIQKYLEFLRDSSGQKPSERTEINGNIGLEKIFITPDESKETNNHIDEFINEQS
ncbi:MAG: hypothetical protein II453_10030 [Alphaproteobacteria bacterium]|nr:hypothetical protein [Alphaproteobacteria bacterium]MBQ3946341.1 hypothetical protein [Alphaproteobacteria bacterium]